MISVLILTLNEEQNIAPLLRSLVRFDDIHVLDSGSSDQTVPMAQDFGAHVATRPLDDWSSQLNWALANLPFAHDFIFQIDADERPTPELIEAMFAAVQSPGDHAAYRLPRHDFFMGRRLRHVQSTPSYIRLYRPERVCFSRLVNPVTHVRGSVGQLDAPLLHQPFSKGLAHWLSRHAAYAGLEAREILRNETSGDFAPRLATALFGKTVQERRRHQKGLYQRLPARPLVKFIWQYVVKRGFLDGRPGLTYALLLFFYECMIVFHTWEGRGKYHASSPENR
ncbi:MAG: glycosyltransferase family 2 protein [Desulfovibrio sp.]|uniref:glycosyltransferase family 2 protein n=1 Tax=Desulfovibrio sp. 7SRBS1 TaxID=3378064 RepID=UPI003B3D2307